MQRILDMRRLQRNSIMRHVTALALTLVTSISTAQDYLANDPVWLQHSVCAVPVPCIATDNFNYYVAGDSVIQGITWKKIVREGQVSFMWQAAPPVGPGCSGTNPYGSDYYNPWLVRQVDRQLRIWVDDADQLLHEFDLQIGQTLPLSYTNWNSDITVAAIDYVQIGSETRARYELNNSWAQYLIEGVGSSNGLFEPLSNFLECGYGLDCFGLGNVSYYPTGWGNSCWIVMDVQTHPEQSRLELVPNPASHEVFVQGSTSGEQVVVRDALGRVVSGLSARSDRMTLDVSRLAEGCYTVQVGSSTARLQVAR